MLRANSIALGGMVVLSVQFLSSCTANDPLISYLNSVSSSAEDFPVSESISLADVYGDKWAQYSLICPYLPRELVDSQLGVDGAPIPEHGLQDWENMIFLQSEDGQQHWASIARNELDLCSPQSPNALELSSTLSVLNVTLSALGGIWTLETS